MAAFPFELVSPERLLFTGEVESVVVPGSEGELTVLKDHAPLMTTLKPGIVTVHETGGRSQRVFVRGGFADVAPTGLTILAESSVPVEQLDAAKLDAEIKDAEDDVTGSLTDEGRRLATEKLNQVRELRGALSL
ncbi:MAG: F0F1 ATP synthase subunit epsilon [Janthinobacterium lividum]